MSPVDKSEPCSLSAHPAPCAPSGMTRAVTRPVCGSACVNGLWRPHTRTRTHTYTRTQRRLHTQLDSLMTRRIQESNSDDGPGWCAQPHATAPRRNCTPTDATRRGRISMRAVTSIHAANYYRKRCNRTRPGNWPPRLDLYSTFRSQGTLQGGSFYRVSRSPALRPPSRDLFLAKNPRSRWLYRGIIKIKIHPFTQPVHLEEIIGHHFTL